MEYWTEREELSSPLAIARSAIGMFAGTGRGVFRLNAERNRWAVWSEAAPIPTMGSLLPGPAGTLFATRYGNAVTLFSRDGTVAATSPNFGTVKLTQTPDGQVWSSGAGVTRLTKKGSALLSQPENVPGDQGEAWDMQYDPRSRRLWTCYAEGLISRQGIGWRLFTMRDGLLENPCSSFAFSANGGAWYGYPDVPAFSRIRLTDGAKPDIRHFRSGGEIGNAHVSFLKTDVRGWLWRGSPEGIYVADETQAERGVWLQLNESDGLPAVTANRECLLQRHRRLRLVGRRQLHHALFAAGRFSPSCRDTANLRFRLDGGRRPSAARGDGRAVCTRSRRDGVHRLARPFPSRRHTLALPRTARETMRGPTAKDSSYRSVPVHG